MKKTTFCGKTLIPVSLLLLFLLTIFSSGMEATGDKIPMDVKSRMLETGDIPVIVILKDKTPFMLSMGNTAASLKNRALDSQQNIVSMIKTEKSNGREIKIKRFWLVNAIALPASPDLIERLAKRDDVERIELDSQLYIIEDTSPIPLGQIDNATSEIKRINATKVWELGINGTGINISVIDTGINASHPDIEGRVIKWVDFVNGNNTIPYDDHGHGTHVAGTAGGNGKSGITTGVAPNVNLFAVKVMDKTGSGNDSDVIRGIEWSVENNANVISMSLGDPASLWKDSNCDLNYPTMAGVINNVIALNITVVVAAGNSGNSGVLFPGCISNMITVGAVDSSDLITYFSSTGYSMRDHGIVAPGLRITSLSSTSGYRLSSGTSMATPHVAGTVALFLDAANRQGTSLTPAQIKSIFNTTSIDLGISGNDNIYGAGRINVFRAVNAVNTTTPEVKSISLDRLDIQFGSIGIGHTSAPQNVTVINIGNVAVNVSATPGNLTKGIDIITASNVGVTGFGSLAYPGIITGSFTLTIPAGTPLGLYNGTIEITAN